MKSLARSAAALLFLLPLAALALTDDEPLSMRYEVPVTSGSQPAAATPRLGEGCSLQVTQVEDLRRHPEFVGSVSFSLLGPLSTPLFTQSIRGADGRQWTTDAIQTLASQGFRPHVGAAPSSASAPGNAVVSVGLKLAQTWSAGLNLLSHVVLRVRYQSGGVEQVRDYHGMGNKINWANGNGEFMTTLNHAMTEALQAFANDAASVCAGRNPATRTASAKE